VKHDNEYKKNALRIFMTIIGVFVIYSVINLGIPQWRPGAMELSGATALIPHPTDNSFPSGHALFSAALLVGLWKYYRRSWLIAVIAVLALATTSARVIGGVHYV
jgi:membrane-associated phospholipid phosphatase